ncbi:polygalacturonase-2 isoform X2 [Selaginella moellendorffii]|uniref:polygalacturonase-2 isoform X2 n=1 Tax=Selaginella moellendorffii TaxID=88036 RepID=UPI000D1C93F6|nr:polygalacturonase-2 isoform X2 [Selaginella moellendorffii]|eukprot:XP_024538207.1 polygalacturonase-2 isoform X2 [Selaginella moellendorffii]
MRAIAMAIAIAFASVGSALEDSDFLFVPPVFDVTSFGALGDGETDDSQAFLSAWEAACFVPSSTVLFPATYSFVIGPVELSGPCADYITLRVDGTIMARDDLSNWNVDLDGWLVFSGLQLFRLTGYGVIDGRGDFWWAYSCKIYPFADCRTKSPTVGYLSSASRTFRTKQKEQAWDRFETSISLIRIAETQQCRGDLLLDLERQPGIPSLSGKLQRGLHDRTTSCCSQRQSQHRWYTYCPLGKRLSPGHSHRHRGRLHLHTNRLV